MFCWRTLQRKGIHCYESKIRIEKNSVQETLVLPLFGKAWAVRNYPDIFKDQDVQQIMDRVDYDFSALEKAAGGVKGKIASLAAATRQAALVWEIRDYLKDRKVIALTGVLADKDYADMYRPVMPLVDCFVCVTPPSPRKLEGSLLAGYLREAGAVAESYDEMTRGVARAVELAGKDGAVLCFGSLYSIGAIREALDQI